MADAVQPITMISGVRVFEPKPRPTPRLSPTPTRGPIVTPVDCSAGDRFIAQTFWASTEKDGDAWTCSDDAVIRVINLGMGAKPVVHGTPFWHGRLTVRVDRLPLAIAGQMIRHRVQHLSEDGGRCGRLTGCPTSARRATAT
jgi:hypothetical protein